MALVLLQAAAAQDLFRTQDSKAQPSQPAQEDPVFRVNVQLVQVDVQVLQKKTKRPIASLSKSDFQLYEDGVPQKITELSRDQLPLSVVLLFDLTDSVQPVLKPLAAGALEALQHLKPEDEVAVMVYAASAEVLQDFTTDRAAAVAAIQRASTMHASQMKGGEEALFNEAVYQASVRLEKAQNPKSRRTIIWLTDNVPNIPNDKKVHSEKQALHEAFESGTVISAMLERSVMSDMFLFSFEKNPLFAGMRAGNPPGNVHKYAEATGGEVMTSSKKDVSMKLAEMIDEIRSRYTLGYYPSAKQPKDKFCEIKVQLAPEVEKREGKLLVHTRQGYYR